jgi:hypothetical protein
MAASATHTWRRAKVTSAPRYLPHAVRAQVGMSAGEQRPHGRQSSGDRKSESDLCNDGLNIASDSNNGSSECQPAAGLRVDGID